MSDGERQILYDIIYMWNLKLKQANEYNKIETDSQIDRTNQWLPVGRGKGEGQDRSKGLTGTSYLRQISNKDLLYNTGNYIQTL